MQRHLSYYFFQSHYGHESRLSKIHECLWRDEALIVLPGCVSIIFFYSGCLSIDCHLQLMANLKEVDKLQMWEFIPVDQNSVPHTTSKSSYCRIEQRPNPGPSRPREGTIHVRHQSFRDLPRESGGEENWVNNPTFDSDSDYIEPPPMKRPNITHSYTIKPAATYNPNYRRPPQPTGVLFDIHCNGCIRRGKNCEKNAFSSSCVVCYRSKNRCDYGQRCRPGPKAKSKDKGKGKKREKADGDDYDSEADMAVYKQQ